MQNEENKTLTHNSRELFQKKLDEARQLVFSLKNKASSIRYENAEYVHHLEEEIASCRKTIRLQNIEITAKERNELNTNQLIIDFIHQHADHWPNKTIQHESVQTCPIIRRAMKYLEITGEY